MDINRRSWEVARLVMQRFGYIGYVMAGVGKPAILDRVEAAFKAIYRAQDLAVGGHIGVFMFRDVFARIAVPHIFGRVGLNPFNFVELTPVQLRIIQTEPEEVETCLDQFFDVADIQYGTAELKAPFAKTELRCQKRKGRDEITSTLNLGLFECFSDPGLGSKVVSF